MVSFLDLQVKQVNWLKARQKRKENRERENVYNVYVCKTLTRHCCWFQEPSLPAYSCIQQAFGL